MIYLHIYLCTYACVYVNIVNQFIHDWILIGHDTPSTESELSDYSAE